MTNSTTPFIDKVTRNDVPALVKLFAADLTDLRLPIDHDALEEVGLTLVGSSQESLFLRVARTELDGEAAGVIVAHGWTSVKFSGPSYWLETLFVSDKYRRLGLGRLLVESLIDHAEENGYHGVDLESYRMNAPASYLYRSLGFRRLGRERYSLSVNL